MQVSDNNVSVTTSPCMWYRDHYLNISDISIQSVFALSGEQLLSAL